LNWSNNPLIVDLQVLAQATGGSLLALSDASSSFGYVHYFAFVNVKMHDIASMAILGSLEGWRLDLDQRKRG
jgi:hypothetical protein